MPRSSMQKQKLLYLQKILLEKTDEHHALTLAELKEQLAAYGIAAERKSLYDDLEILEKFGIDICKIRSKSTRYYVGNRNFEIPELKLLVDAIQSSKFITHKKSLTLIKKLEGLVSENDGKQLQRQVYVANRIKTVNERIYYNVDNIHNAISENKKIRFKYFKLKVNFGTEEKIVKVVRKNGAPYVVSPWALCWDDENYYLIGYDEDADLIKHYRVDKMEDIEIIDSPRKGDDKFKSFDIASYSKSVFSMFGGNETEVMLSADNDLVGVVADRFGKNVFITKESDATFCISVNVMLSPQFYAWVFGFGGKMRILSPKNAVDEFKAQIASVQKSCK